MSQITKRGTGGGGSDITLNANNGSPLVGTSFNIFGAEFGTGPTPVNSTYTDLGNFFIENRAWTTPYVVDSNVTSGERGTFSTIQAAVDQAVADGYTRVGNGLIAVIEVRSDNQIGNIDIPENALIHIHGQTPEGSPDNNFFGSFIGGVITFGASSFVVLENLVLQTGGGDIFSLPNNNSGCIMHQCYCLDGISVLGAATFFAAQECTFTGVTLNSPTSSLNSPTIFIDCSFLTTMPMTLNSYARFSECIIPSIVLSDNAYFEIYNCFNISGGDVISGTTTGTCVADGFYGRSLGAPAFLFNFTGSLRYSNVSVRGGGHLFGPNVTLIKSLEPEGNYLQSLGVSSAHVITLGEHCIDVDSSGGPLTISLPADAHPEQEFIIIDSSQSAMTNPITVDVDGGGTINQNTDYIIQSNGGSVCVKALSSAGDFEIVWVSKPFGPPQFLAQKTGNSTNATGNGTPFTVPFSSEIVDLWGNWDSNTTFTAPVTGLYQFNVCVTLTNLLAAHNAGALYLITSNRDYVLYNSNVGAVRDPAGALTICGSVIANMDVGDTAQIILTVAGSTNTVTVVGSGSHTYFSGNLINPLF